MLREKNIYQFRKKNVDLWGSKNLKKRENLFYLKSSTNITFFGLQLPYQKHERADVYTKLHCAQSMTMITSPSYFL